MVPLRLFLFDSVLVWLVERSSCTSSVSVSSVTSSGVGSNGADRARFSGLVGWFRNGETFVGGVPAVRDGAGIEARLIAALDVLGGGLVGERGRDACDID